jgi:hypothetical protein
VEKKPFKQRSKKQWDEFWRSAFQQGICPMGGCNISKSLCQHVDKYLKYGTPQFSGHDSEVWTREVDDIEDLTGDGIPTFFNTEGVWELFKKLRQVPGLSNTQIKLLIRRGALKQHFRLIMRELDLKSWDVMIRRYRKALETLRRHGIE